MPNSPLDLLLLTLATYRLARLLTNEQGPGRIVGRMRNLFTANGSAPGSMGELWTCIKCMSVWVAFGVLALYIYAPVIVWGFAISGAALMLRSYTGVDIS